MMFESDSGVFRPTGFGFTGSDAARARVTEIATLLRGIQADRITAAGEGADIGPSVEAGRMPSMSLDVDGPYFLLHHTAADTVDKIDPMDMSRAAAAIAVLSYVTAEMDGATAIVGSAALTWPLWPVEGAGLPAGCKPVRACRGAAGCWIRFPGRPLPRRGTRGASGVLVGLRGVALLQVHGIDLAPQPQVDHLDEDREAHREVDVALRDVLVEALGDQRHADQQQERQRQHLDRRVPVDEAR